MDEVLEALYVSFNPGKDDRYPTDKQLIIAYTKLDEIIKCMTVIDNSASLSCIGLMVYQNSVLNMINARGIRINFNG